jgi:V-type H+-transporting ATPase subunit a
MAYYDLVMPRESVWEILNELGSINKLEFKDLNDNHPLMRSPAIVKNIRRCELMES